MTATIHAFPNQIERDKLEFDRTDSSPYIRAIDEAVALAKIVMESHDRAAVIGRIGALRRSVERMETYRDDLDDLVLLDHECEITLRAIPGTLARLCGMAQSRLGSSSGTAPISQDA